MTLPHKTDWNPGAYDRFRGLRLQPAMDLLSTIEGLPLGPVVDLGCGSGAVGPALTQRFPDRKVVGLDASPAMLEKAAKTGAYAALREADIADWQAEEPPALVFSNAALQWLGDHATLMPRLVSLLAPHGVLAVQMPHQNSAASHRGWSDAFRHLFGDRPIAQGPDILSPETYFDLLSPLGDFRVWETEYIQHLAPNETGHPVRFFTESTFGRPYLDAVDAGEKPKLIADYEARLDAAYPLRDDGSVLFAFRRLFFTVRVT